MKMLVSQISNDANGYLALRNLQDFMGKVPIVHIEDVCQAHIFCMEEHSITGRFLCASTEIGDCYQKKYPDFHLNHEYLGGALQSLLSGALQSLLKGAEVDTKMILDDSIKFWVIRKCIFLNWDMNFCFVMVEKLTVKK